ncbi:hypothetical protein P4118_25395 [Pseudomonas aeruginosa]|nr:hypothetical protein [Pseudomonas aeruginosa]
MPAPLSPLIVRMRHAIEGCRPIQIRGRVTQVTGTLLKAVVPGVRIGELCQLRNPDQSLALLAEVIGFQQHQALLTRSARCSGFPPTPKSALPAACIAWRLASTCSGRCSTASAAPSTAARRPSRRPGIRSTGMLRRR